MDSQIVTAAPVQAPPQPVMQADTRPTADTAAVVKDTTPEVPLPFPASLGPVGEVNKSRLAPSEQTDAEQTDAEQTESAFATSGLSPSGTDSVTPLERTLKPYGISMLPHTPPE